MRGNEAHFECFDDSLYPKHKVLDFYHCYKEDSVFQGKEP